ncbi:MAG: S1C family serine protease, partial [Dehalococcoidia bacterium]|nr:S1C family serine protease [Dehalococcoidia bacterium]
AAVRQAVVRITYTFSTTDALGRSRSAQSTGSGIIYSQQGLLVTNEHVVDDAPGPVTVELLDGRVFLGTVVGKDTFSDVAVVRIPGGALPVARFADSDTLRVGQPVIALGHSPLIPRPTDGRPGRILALDGQSFFARGAQHRNLIVTDAPIFEGDSGGPLIDLSGAVIGMNVLRLRDRVTREFEYMHIPSNRVMAVANAIVATGRVSRPFMGVSASEVTPDLAAIYGLPVARGILVTDVIPGTGAAAAGLRPGDVIIAVDGVAVATRNQLQAVIDTLTPGQTVVVTLATPLGPRQTPLTIGERP